MGIGNAELWNQSQGVLNLSETCQLSPFVGYLLPLDVHRVLAVTVGCVSNAIPS